jgi:cytochrome P450
LLTSQINHTGSRRTPPGPRGQILLGSLLKVRRDRLGFLTEITRQYGDVVRFRMGVQLLHVVNHPEYIRHVLQDNNENYQKGVGLAQAKRWLGEGLVTSEGAVWARQRRLIQPAFQRQRISRYSSVVTEATSEMIQRWETCAGQGQSIDVASQITQLTLGIITRVMFSTDITAASDVGAAFTTALKDAMDRMTAIVILPKWLPVPANLRFNRALRTLEGIVDMIIRKHLCEGSTQQDLLSLLSAEHVETQGCLGKRELRDQVMTILLVGHETTANSIAWAFYLLSKHQWAWQRMRDEVEQTLAGRVPTYEDLPGLSWTRMVYEESLRLYPPVWLIPRRAIEADEVGGYYIPAQSHVLISPYVMHRHPSYWNQPEEFNPERFSPEQINRRQQHTYLPFGAGPRACVGGSLAMMEALMILAMVTQKYRLQLLSGFNVAPEPLLTLRFRRGLAMTPIRL